VAEVFVRGIPEAVRRKALAAGAAGWLEGLPALVADLEREWAIRVGPPLDGGTEAFVAEATLEDGRAAVLKLLVPRDGEAAHFEATVLRLAGGEGCAQLFRDDVDRGALLLERLGRSLHDVGLPIARRHEILCAAAERLWRPAPGCALPTGAAKGRWLAEFIPALWEELDRPCSERAVDDALSCVERRVAAHDDERAELLHGDAHQRARMLARRTGLDATANWEWGVVERVSTGLVLTRIHLQPVGREMLEVADRVSAT